MVHFFLIIFFRHASLLNPTENFYTRRLQNSKEGSIHRQLFESKRLPVTDNMDHDLFIPHLLSRENTAYYVPSEVVSGFGSKACGIYAPYKEMYPNLASVAFPKKSPFYQFFQSRLLMLVQNGQWDIIKRRLSTANCKDSKADEDNSSTSMGIGKLSFLFSIIGFGYFCACLVFAQELLRARAKTTSVGQKLHGSCVVRGHEGKRDLI